jgi:diadenosine tetraphosphate (Ap4A) HIT family hydrolase
MEVYEPIAAPSLLVTRLGLYAEGRFPGRCIVVYRTHAEHMEELQPDALAALWADAARVGDAVKRLTGAARINYAVLGNTTAHLHVHVIPRQPGAEPLPTRPPWNDPRDLVPLDTAQAARMKASLGAMLG